MTALLDRIPSLAALLAETGIDELELSGPAGRVLLRRNGAAVPAAAPPPGTSLASDAPADPSPSGAWTVAVTSPGIGAFLRAHPLHDAPLAEEGAGVAAGQVLALLRVGALLQPVRSPAAGILASVRREEGALTGFGDPLFDILTSA